MDNPGAADLNPVRMSGTLPVFPNTLTQTWTFQAVGSIDGPSTSVSIRDASFETWISNTMATTVSIISNLNPAHAQVTVHNARLRWNMTIVRNDGSAFVVRLNERASGLAATSWPLISSTRIGLTSPLTLETSDPSSLEQIFTVTPIES
ncbi:hypothetical protein MVEN_02211100 [Mycena venus]|uniref:Uncharacterized protein n=1 Tax=Mycena venus TaxID=2733690 RepID=A0A8H6X7P5_9AGAR|nr:hypothetical protein MVEN_02211100 [Mycena venus]